MKKNLLFIIVFTIICSFSATLFVKPKLSFAQEITDDFKSKSCYLTDYSTGTVIYAKNETERLPIASMCKIMTLLLCFENVDNGVISIEDTVCVSENASGMGGSQVFLETNGNYLVKDLIKSIVVASANDACVAMAETLCGSESAFVTKMNEKASSLGMDNTNFVNATGLPQVGQYSCAKDVSIMFRELLKHKTYYEFSTVWMDKIAHPNDRFTEISNTNKLIRHYKGCDGGKTGYTSEAGHCLTATATRNGLRLISVVISAPDSKTRFKEVSNMFNFGFANYCVKSIINKDEKFNEKCEVINGKRTDVSVKPAENFSYLSKKDEKIAFDFEVVFNKLTAPVRVNQHVGEIIIYKDNVEIKRIKLLANENVEKKDFIDHLKDIADNWKIV